MPEMTLQQAFDTAVAQHNAGRLSEAESLYRQILVYQPQHIESMRMLAKLEHQRGHFAGAEHLLRQVIAMRPGVPDYHVNLGTVLATAGKPDAAIEAFRAAIAINPDIPEVYNNLGNALLARGEADAALDAYHRAVTLRPDYFEALVSFGRLLSSKGLAGDAIEAYSRAVALRPDDAETQFQLGRSLYAVGQFDRALLAFSNTVQLRPADPAAMVALSESLRSLGRTPEANATLTRAVDLNATDAELHYRLGQALLQDGPSDTAIAHLEQAVHLRPGYVDALDSLGVALSQRGRLDQALHASSQAIALAPDSAIVHNNLGTVLQRCERPADAVGHYRRALELNQNYPEAQNNLGSALWDSGQLEDGRRELAKALELKPGYSAIEANLGMMMLTLGDFENGWKTYEARSKVIPLSLENHPSPRWDGSPLDGKRIILQSEQGFGDTLQFVRYLPMVQARGGSVILQCQPLLKRLLASLRGVEQVIDLDDPIPPFDVRSRLMSLPGIFNANLQTIPHDVPYLLPAPTDVAQWHDRIASLSTSLPPSPTPPLTHSSCLPTSALKVGLAWAGSAEHPHDLLRSVTLAALAELAPIPGVQFFSLQLGKPGRQAEHPPEGMRVVDWTHDLHDFADTAALVQNLDLVISVDSAVAHLAGALGIRTWVLVQFVPDWRWLTERTDSPWYPTMKLFRQISHNDWTHPISQLARELAGLASAH